MREIIIIALEKRIYPIKESISIFGKRKMDSGRSIAIFGIAVCHKASKKSLKST
jgi:hypothetical protein